ncbi:MAG: hypothetical protein Q4C75_05610, partial [Bergeyella zoohelcum]|nr:hypothetical protein [Bergeyella zoohelcum]
DDDPNTQLEIAKLHFVNGDYNNSKAVLDKVFDQVKDPIKYKLKAYLVFGSNADYALAKQNLDLFINNVTDKSRIQPADTGLEGLIIAGLAKNEQDATKKQQMLAEAMQKIQVAKNVKDATLDWDAELGKIQGGVSEEAALAGPTNPTIEGLRAKLKTDPKDVNALVELGSAYQQAQNWNGAILTWDKMIALNPNWAYSYYAKGSSYQQMGNHEMAEASYQKFIDVVNGLSAEEQAQNKETLSYAYYLVAHYSQEKNLVKAKEYAAKAVELNPSYQDAVEFHKAISAK